MLSANADPCHWYGVYAIELLSSKAKVLYLNKSPLVKSRAEKTMPWAGVKEGKK